MSTAFTFYFSDIFPDYATFKDFNSKYQCVNLYTEETDAFLSYCYKILSRYFWNANIRYTDPNAFCRQFANVLENRFIQYQIQDQYLRKLYALTDKDILTVREALNNVADNPNTMPEDPREPLQFISSQTFGYVTDNKLKAYLNAVNQMPNLRINEFIRGRAEYRDEISFLDLFMNVQPNITYLYDKGE